MAHHGNNRVGETYGAPRQSKTRAPRHVTEIPELATDTNASSSKPPSIVGLENLRFQGMDNFTVDTTTSTPPRRLPKRSPVRASHVPKREEHAHSERSQVTVYLTVVILKLGEVETIKEYFVADVYLQAKWREPLLDQTNTDVTDFRQLWNPEIVIQNILDSPTETVWHEVQHDRKGQAFVYEMRRVKGKFFETMELNEFPFDVQSMTLVISSELTKEELQIVEDKSEISSIHTECFADSQEWELHDFVELDPLDISPQYTKASQSYPGILATCCVSRRSGFFAWNVLLIVNLLNIFAFTTFSVSPTLPQNRLQLSFILILSAISFRFVTNQSIPKISYLTHLDRYVLTSMVFCGFITFWHAILSRFSYDVTLQNNLDFYMFIIFAVTYFLFQVIFIIVMIYRRWKRLNHLKGKEEQYKAKANSIMGGLWGHLRSTVSTVSSQFDRRPNFVAGRRYPRATKPERGVVRPTTTRS